MVIVDNWLNVNIMVSLVSFKFMVISSLLLIVIFYLVKAKCFSMMRNRNVKTFVIERMVRVDVMFFIDIASFPSMESLSAMLVDGLLYDKVMRWCSMIIRHVLVGYHISLTIVERIMLVASLLDCCQMLVDMLVFYLYHMLVKMINWIIK